MSRYSRGPVRRRVVPDHDLASSPTTSRRARSRRTSAADAGDCASGRPRPSRLGGRSRRPRGSFVHRLNRRRLAAALDGPRPADVRRLRLADGLDAGPTVRSSGRSGPPGYGSLMTWCATAPRSSAPTCCSSARRAATCCSSSPCATPGSGFARAWVTFDKSDARSLLDGERVFYAHGPTNRNLKNLLRNLLLAVARRRARCGRRSSSRPARASPSRSPGSRGCAARSVVYVESLTRIEGPSLTLPADRAVAIAPLRAVARARRDAARAHASPATSSRRAHDLRQRRHQRSALRPAAARGRGAAARRGARRPARRTRRDRAARARSSSTSSPSRRWSRRSAAPASSSRTPASARSWSRSRTASARSSCRA